MGWASHAMVTKAVRYLSMILGEAVQRGWLVAHNVARGVKVKRPRAEKQKLAKRADNRPIEDLKALIEAADRLRNEDARLSVMVRVVMLAGLRASELRGFARPGAELRADQPSLTVSQRADRWNELGAPKSNAGTRTIPIGPALATSLKAWKLRCPPCDFNLMFPNRPKGRQWPSSMGRTGGGPIKQHTMAALPLKVQGGRAGDRQWQADQGRRDDLGSALRLAPLAARRGLQLVE
jgi:integrase